MLWGGKNLSSSITLPVTNLANGIWIYGSAFFGISLTTGDINGDNKTDLVVGNLGKVNVIFASNVVTYSVSQSVSLINNKVSFTDNSGEAEYLAYSSIAAGDINGDAFDDVVVGAIFALGYRGRIYIFFGSANTQSLSISSSSTPTGTTWSRINGNIDNGQLGVSVGIVHGIPGTSDDIVLGAPFAPDDLGTSYLVCRSTCKQKLSLCIRCIG